MGARGLARRSAALTREGRTGEGVSAAASSTGERSKCHALNIAAATPTSRPGRSACGLGAREGLRRRVRKGASARPRVRQQAPAPWVGGWGVRPPNLVSAVVVRCKPGGASVQSRHTPCVRHLRRSAAEAGERERATGGVPDYHRHQSRGGLAILPGVCRPDRLYGRACSYAARRAAHVFTSAAPSPPRATMRRAKPVATGEAWLREPWRLPDDAPFLAPGLAVTVAFDDHGTQLNGHVVEWFMGTERERADAEWHQQARPVAALCVTPATARHPRTRLLGSARLGNRRRVTRADDAPARAVVPVALAARTGRPGRPCRCLCASATALCFMLSARGCSRPASAPQRRGDEALRRAARPSKTWCAPAAGQGVCQRAFLVLLAHGRRGRRWSGWPPMATREGRGRGRGRGRCPTLLCLLCQAARRRAGLPRWRCKSCPCRLQRAARRRAPRLLRARQTRLAQLRSLRRAPSARAAETAREAQTCVRRRDGPGCLAQRRSTMGRCAAGCPGRCRRSRRSLRSWLTCELPRSSPRSC